jgi:hypothetical protein
MSLGELRVNRGVRLRAEEARHEAHGDEAGDDTGDQQEVDESDHEHLERPFAS